MISLEAFTDILCQVFPEAHVRIESGRFGDRARAGPLKLESLQYSYLSPSSEGRVELLLYPADTLTQMAATTRHLTEQAAWLSAAQADAVVAAVDQAQIVAESKRPADQFQTAVDQATAAVNQTFGLSTS